MGPESLRPDASASRPLSRAELLERAVRLHEQGLLEEAAALYATLLEADPADLDSLHLLGVVRLQQGRAQEALERISAALEGRSQSADMHSNLGLALQALGRTAEALASYERAVALQPGHATAHNHCGMALHALGRPSRALECYEHALRLRPRHAKTLNNRGMALQALERSEEALASYEQALALDPDFREALHNHAALLQLLGRLRDALPSLERLVALRPGDADAEWGRGTLLHRLWRPSEALASHERALSLQPDHVEARVGRGAALYRLGRWEEAVAAFEAVLVLAPQHAGAFYNRGVVLDSLGRSEEAVASYDRALELRPDDAEALGARGGALARLGRAEEALESCRRALELAPDNAEVIYDHAIALQRLGRCEEAVRAYDAALAVEPRHLLAWSNRGTALYDLDRQADAIESFERALALYPGYDEVRWNESLSHLLLGDLARGWPLFESRLGMRAYDGYRNIERTPWRGQDLAGKWIMLFAEQGVGDTLQFVRYVPQVAARGGRVVLVVQPSLLDLLAGFPGVARVVPQGGSASFDLHCPLMSLPLVFGTVLETIPAQVPYLTAPPDRVARWSRRLGPATGPRIGLAWAGNAEHQADHKRSIALERLLPLTRLPGVEVVSLQKEVREQDRAALADSAILPLGEELADFADTAAVISLLDLVISVDTAVAHLAGALASPVWVLVSSVPDWRWLREREDSPWYPTARLFRQTHRDDWEGVVARVVDALGSGFAADAPGSGRR